MELDPSSAKTKSLGELTFVIILMSGRCITHVMICGSERMIQSYLIM